MRLRRELLRVSAGICLLLAMLLPAGCGAEAAAMEAMKLQDGTDVALWRPGPGTPGPWPLVLFSHGLGGCRDQSADILGDLADRGQLIVAVNHADQRCGRLPTAAGFPHPASFTDATFRDRLEQLRRLHASILREPGLAAKFDTNKLVLIGHSLGGYTVLGMAGARATWKFTGVAAVVAWAPFTAPYLLNHGVKNIAVATLYEAGDTDFVVAAADVKKAFDDTPAPTCLVARAGANHFAWVDQRAMPDFAQPAYRRAIVDSTAAFLELALAKKVDAAAAARVSPDAVCK